MAIYAQVERVKGTKYGIVTALQDMGSHVPEAAPPLYWVDTTGVNPQPQAGWFYDHDTATFSDTNPGVVFDKQKFTPYTLWYKKVTADERGEIFALSQQDGGGYTLTMVQRGRLQAFLTFSTANTVDMNDPEVSFIFNALESIGLLDPGRAAEIIG